MKFAVQLAVNVAYDGWTTTRHLPTIYIFAATEGDARSKAEDLIASMKEGAFILDLVAI